MLILQAGWVDIPCGHGTLNYSTTISRPWSGRQDSTKSSVRHATQKVSEKPLNAQIKITSDTPLNMMALPVFNNPVGWYSCLRNNLDCWECNLWSDIRLCSPSPLHHILSYSNENYTVHFSMLSHGKMVPCAPGVPWARPPTAHLPSPKLHTTCVWSLAYQAR